MSPLTLLKKGIRKLNEKLNDDTPESYRKGQAYEEYVRKVLFPKDRYALIHRSDSYQQNKEDYAESSLEPDFKLRDKETGKEFYVECKYRSGALNATNQIEWCKPFQLRRYREYDQNIPVFVSLGIGGKAGNPEENILFPLEACNFCGLYQSFMDDFSFAYTNRPVFSSYLWNL